MSDTQQQFTLILNGQANQFKARTFAKVSKKGKELMKSEIYEATVDKAISDEAASAFISACNIQPFKVTSTNAFDLLDLSIDWGITNLEKFVRQYCKQKNLERPEPIDNKDYLAILIEKQQRRELQLEDYRNVATRIDKYITDERLFELPTLTLFRLILVSEYTPIDDQQLVDFVLKMIERKPHTAVPLLLRINYELLTHEQEDKIFDTSEVHDQNLGFFVSSSFSATRNRIYRLLNALESSVKNQLKDTNDDHKKTVANNSKALDDEYRRQLEDLSNMAIAQKQQIEDLKQYRDRTNIRRNEVAEEFAQHNASLSKEREKVDDQMERRKEMTDILRRQINNEINKQVGRVREKVIDNLAKVRETDQDRRESGEGPRKDQLSSLQRNVERMKKNCLTIKSTVKGTADETQGVQATLAAKMVKDFMRFDNFIRRTERRFKIFDEQKIWTLSSAEVKKSEDELSEVEKKLDKICPIRHTVTNKK